MSDQVEEIKQKVDVAEIVGERVTLKKAGRNLKGLCPFHSEKTPSFMVSPERQSYKCFGCGRGGDVYSFLQEYEGMSFLETLEYLAKRTGIKLESYRPTSQDLRKKRILEALHLASEYYAWVLEKHDAGARAREYLKERKVSGEAVRVFGLGYAPSSWRGVSEYLTKKKGYSEDEILDAGLVIRGERGIYDRFRGRVMFPLRDHKGSVVGFSGRVVPGGESGEREGAKYINTPETSVYSKSKMLYGLYENRAEIKRKDQIILVEGELDVIPSWQAGVRWAVAIKGSAFTEEQARLIVRYTRNAVMALDADLAGEEAIKRAVKVAESMDLNISVVQITGGKDPGDVATEDPKDWREMVKKTTNYYDFLLSSLAKRHDVKTGEGARKIAEEYTPVLAEITNAVVRAHYAREAASALGVPEDSIYEEIERVHKKRQLAGLKEKVTKIESSEVSRRERVEEYFLALALQFYPEVKEELGRVAAESFSNPGIRKLVERLITHKGEFGIKKFGAGAPPELQEMVDRAYMRDLTSVAPEKRAKELMRMGDEVMGMAARERMKEIAGLIAKAEEEGKETAMLQAEFAKLSKVLAGLAGLG